MLRIIIIIFPKSQWNSIIRKLQQAYWGWALFRVKCVGPRYILVDKAGRIPEWRSVHWYLNVTILYPLGTLVLLLKWKLKNFARKFELHQWLSLGTYAPCEHSEIPAISGKADREIGWPQAPQNVNDTSFLYQTHNSHHVTLLISWIQCCYSCKQHLLLPLD